MKLRLAFFVALLAVLSAPAFARSKVKIDGSDGAGFGASVQEMRSGLSNKENCLLSSAFTRIQVADKDRKAKSTGGKDPTPGPLRTKIAGMTYEQIIAYSETFDANVTANCRD
jgi:hypothetical protein